MKYVTFHKFNYVSFYLNYYNNSNTQGGSWVGESLLLLTAVKSTVHTVLDFTPECMCLLFAPISDDDYSRHVTACIKSMSSQTK